MFIAHPNGTFRKHARGFTLLEVALGVTILAVLAGTMFTIVQGSLRAASEIQVVQRDNRRLDRFIETLRQAFRTMPANARISLVMVERAPMRQEITFSGVPEAFAWGDEPVVRENFTLALQPYPEALVAEGDPEYYLAITRPSFFRPEEGEGPQEMLMNASVTIPLGQKNVPLIADERSRYWLPLAPAVRDMTWRFYQTDKKRWVEESGAVRPPLVELTLFPFERNTPIRVVFATR